MKGRQHSTRILVVDDDGATCAALRRALALEGYEVATSRSAEAAVKHLQSHDVQLVITDLVMGGMSGLGLLDHVQANQPEVPLIVCTGYGTIESAVKAMRLGAADYLTKPVNLEALAMTVQKALATAALKADNRALRSQLEERHSFFDIIGRAPRMKAVFEQLATIAPTDVTVVIRGESGTGKEVVARAVHNASKRAAGPMVIVDCAAIAESLVESELFGHERGAFTGASKQKRGKLELAHGGTLFLDEIGELSPTTQTRLLRFLQEQEIERVGGTKKVSVDVRIVAATHRDLERMVEEGGFRQDLYYRLNVVSVELPPLRERREDIELLARHFLSDLSSSYGRPQPVLHRSAKNALLAYHWPGNVRELRNLCENLVVTTRNGVITASSLPSHFVPEIPAESGGDLLDGKQRLADIERHVIFQTLARAGGNKVEAAHTLGIGLKTLYRRLGEYASEDPSSD